MPLVVLYNGCMDSRGGQLFAAVSGIAVPEDTIGFTSEAIAAAKAKMRLALLQAIERDLARRRNGPVAAPDNLFPWTIDLS